jgi:hypothetical protein
MEVDRKDSCSDLSDYLPTLNCIEDVFQILGVWETAETLRDQDLTWTHIAEELGYNTDSMYAALYAIIEAHLHEAKTLGLITYEQYESKLANYSEKALRWINEIF